MRCRRCSNRCVRRFDIIVLDGPPVLGLADAPLLAHCAEATIVCAVPELTRSDALQGALRRLLAAQAHVLGTLLTRFDLKQRGLRLRFQLLRVWQQRQLSIGWWRA